MSGLLSLSVFAIEADRVPVFALEARKQSDAEAILLDDAIPDKLRLLKSDGKPLSDRFSIFRVRLARQNEKALYHENAFSLVASNGRLAVLLVRPDEA